MRCIDKSELISFEPVLTKKAKYALNALSFIAQQDLNHPQTAATIAKENNIPLKFLESILSELKKNGTLKSIHGKGGGVKRR